MFLVQRTKVSEEPPSKPTDILTKDSGSEGSNNQGVLPKVSVLCNIYFKAPFFCKQVIST